MGKGDYFDQAQKMLEIRDTLINLQLMTLIKQQLVKVL